jgi:outer membrane protein OmpA-like peptidoglycan-associated protein
MNSKITVSLLVGALFGATPAFAFAQGARPADAIATSNVLSQISVFSYYDGRKSHLLFRSTPIAEKAAGTAQVEYQGGNAQITADVEALPEPASLGPYSVYVLWAITPDGRASNEGVLVGVDGGKGRIETQYNASQFALIVTAEPHFAVTVPSTMVALYNIADGVKGNESKVTTLAESSDYSALPRVAFDAKTDSQEIVQARYSLAMARAAGAERFASAPYAAANEKLAAAEAAARGDRNARKTAPAFAREAVIAGEDARRASMIAMAAAKVDGDRVAAAQAATTAANETAAIATAAASATAAAATATAAEAAATATATAARVASEASADAAAQAANEATVAATDTERARSAEAATVAARADLLARLNDALPTHESSRGLVSSIGGVKFVTGSADINGSGRESVAKFSGIVASYPGMQFNVEGHTDSTGTDATNQRLSMSRAATVRDYLVAQGIPAARIGVVGLGSSMPIADNATVDGRASNRRVEIVISGGPLASR